MEHSTLETCSPEPYFTEAQIQDVQWALRLIKDIGIKIYPASHDSQRTTFFDQAKLWHIIKVIIYKLFIDKLIDRKLIFRHNGKKYYLTEIPEGEEDNFRTDM